MKHQNYFSMTMQNIDFFLTVAETVNMRKAAGILNVTQPLLSQRIAQMETELGLRLFHREKRSLSLTPAGIAFAADCKQYISLLNAAIDRAQSIHNNLSTHITVGLYSALNRKMRRLISQCIESARPDFSIDFRLFDLCEYQTILQTNDVDIMFLPDYENLQREPELVTVLVGMYSLCATMSQTHPLAQKDTLCWSDLDGVDIFLHNQLMNSGYARSLRENCLLEGFDPLLIPFDNSETLQLYMSLGRGVGLAITNLHQESADVLVSRIIENSDYPVILACNKDSPHKCLPDFARLIAPVIATVFDQMA